MHWSFPIGAIRGTVIRVHVTFLLLLAWIAFAANASGGPDAAVQGVVFVVALFFCIVLHELGHALAAAHYGIKTPDITLLPIGGVARIERIPEQPGQELVIALAGPAVSLLIAAGLFLALHGSFPRGRLDLARPGMGLLAQLAAANLFLVIFNAIPAFPMDGGRVLRALLAFRLGHGRATRIAATVGQVLAFALGLMGLFGNPFLLFIGIFVWFGATAEAHAEQIQEVSRGILAGDVAITSFASLSPLSQVSDALQHLAHTTQHDFPVVDGGGRLRGVLTRDAVIRALYRDGPETPVFEVMAHDIPSVNSRASLAEALRLLQAGPLPAVGVVDSGGRLIGLITPEKVGEFMMLHAARDARRGSRAAARPNAAP